MNYRKGLTLLGSASVGALIMLLADPVSGKRRRSLIRDQVTKANRRVGRAFQRKSEDAKNRLYGMYCETRSFWGKSRDQESEPVRRTG